MKSFAILSLLSLVSAAPLVERANAPAGAAYWITNEPSGNMIISANIGADGKLSLAQSTSAGGRGSHGNDAPDPAGPDALFSQGAVKANAKSQMLAAVNSGSNTMAVFKIDPANPAAIKMVGQPVSSEGEFPMSVAFNEAGNMACVANGGAVNGVNCFKVDKNTGLASIPNSARSLGLNQTTPPAGPAGTVSHVIFNEAGNQLLASVKGMPPTPGFVAMWDVMPDGSLSQNMTKVAPPQGGVLPFGMTVVPGQNAVMVTDAGIGFDVYDMSGAAAASNNSQASNSTAPSASNSTASANSTSSDSSNSSASTNTSMAIASTDASDSVNVTAGGKSSANEVKGQGAVCWVSHSTQTGNFYMTDIKTSMVTEVNLDKNLKANIVKQYPQANSSATIDTDVAKVNGKDMLYILSPGTTSVNVMELNAPGQAQNVQTVNFADTAKQAGVAVNTNNLQGMTTFVKA